jgi:hypothetical protein
MTSIRDDQRVLGRSQLHRAEGQSTEWRRVVDTAQPSPEDIVEPGNEPPLLTASYTVRARSVVVLRREQDARPDLSLDWEKLGIHEAFAIDSDSTVHRTSATTARLDATASSFLLALDAGS